MHIYLVQHGAAVPKDENPEKPLSDSGRDDIKKMASFLARSHVSAARVIHSGKLRALETALLLAEVLGPGNVVEEIESGLAPNDSTDALFAAIDGWTEDTIIVGHLPFMSKMVSRLVTGNEDGIKHVAMNVLYSLSHLGYAIPPQADCGWIGEAGPGPSYGDDGAGLDNEFTQGKTTIMTWNLMHLARMLKDAGGIPAHGNQKSLWDKGERFDHPNPEYR